MIFEQGKADSVDEDAPDGAVIVEFHFALGGMDVDVNGSGIHFEEKAADRIATFHERGVIAFEEREVEHAVFDGTTVNEKVLVFASGTREARFSDEAPDAKRGRGCPLILTLSPGGGEGLLIVGCG